MRLLFSFLLLLAPLARAEVFSIVQYGDIHAASRSRNYNATNTVPWILTHTNVVNDGFGTRAGYIKGTALMGDCYEDDESSTTNYYNPSADDSTYTTVQLTNDARILAQSGTMLFVTTGNHDADNTNNVVGWCHTNATLPWSSVFPPSWFTSQSYFVTNKTPGAYHNMVMKLRVGGTKLKFISYWTDPDTNSVQSVIYSNQTVWVRQQMQADPDYNAIVCAHYLLGKDTNDVFGTNIVPSYADHNPVYANTGPGNAPIENGILAEPNLLGFMSGHNLRVFKGIYETNGTDGHAVKFVQFNTQSSLTNNCNWINVWTFDTVAATVSVGTYDIRRGAWFNDGETNYNGTSAWFANGFRHDLTWPLAIRSRIYPVWKR